ncbi:MAG: O-antigen ligase family protein [Paludibacteraceae bacterium]
MNEMGTGRVALICGISALCWVVCAFWYVKDIAIVPISSKTSPFRQRTVQWYSWYVLLVGISIIITNHADTKELIYHLLVFVLPLFGLWGTYGYARRFGEQPHFYKMIAFVILCIVVAYGVVYSTYNVLGERGHFGVAYYPLYLLPLMLACDKRWVRYVALVVIGVVIISSVKRGGLLALAMGLLVYLLVKRHIDKKGMKGLIITFLVVAMVTVVFYLAVVNLGDNVLERLFNSDDDTGNGRTEIWAGIFRRLEEQGLSNWIFGNGYLATMAGTSNGSWSGFSAHNDFLECLYDYGAVTLFCYLGFLFSWARYILRTIRQHSRFAAPLAMMWVMYVILSMISIIIIYYTSLLSMITVGTLIGWNEFEQHKALTNAKK